MRTTVTLDDDVYESARQLARTSQRRLGEVLSELARRGLTGARPAKKGGLAGFPNGPDPPSQAALAAEEAIDEENLF